MMGATHIVSNVHWNGFAPLLIVAQVSNMLNAYWVLRLLFVAPTHKFLCLKFDPLCDKPHLVSANIE